MIIFGYVTYFCSIGAMFTRPLPLVPCPLSLVPTPYFPLQLHRHLQPAAFFKVVNCQFYQSVNQLSIGNTAGLP